MTTTKPKGRGKSKSIWRTVDGVEQKRCPRCGEWLPADKAHFYHKGDTLLGCRPCSREVGRDYQRPRYVPRSQAKPQTAPAQSFDASGLLAAFGGKT